MIFIDGIAYGDRVRSKYQWYNEGEKSSKFFLKSTFLTLKTNVIFIDKRKKLLLIIKKFRKRKKLIFSIT